MLLTNLAQTLQTINLGNNRIDAVVGRYKCLPEDLDSANFSTTYEELRMASLETKNRPVKYISLDGSPMDELIELNRCDEASYTIEKSFLPFDRGTVQGY